LIYIDLRRFKMRYILTCVTDISTATLAWMLQCVSPHLTIDQDAYNGFIDQYKRWLFRIRFACTYHHQTTWESIKLHLPKRPRIPLLDKKTSELDPPRRDPVHTHPEFNFGWGTGRLVDSFGGFYHLLGSHTRLPGHEDVEIYDEEDDVYNWKPIKEVGLTNEYIHPIVYHRSVVHGWDKHCPLKKHWTREHRQGKDGDARFWWYMKNEKDTNALPEWVILPDVEGKPNFERAWYRKCEKADEAKKGKLGDIVAFVKEDFLESLDEEIDFAFDEKPQNEWP
jgi:hypothetical protein